jgi:hypothetical protein
MRMRAPQLVGRDGEVDELDRILTEARKGQGGAVFVIGEPGIGKTRLAAEAVSHAYGAEMVVLRGRGSTMGPAVPAADRGAAHGGPGRRHPRRR